MENFNPALNYGKQSQHLVSSNVLQISQDDIEKEPASETKPTRRVEWERRDCWEEE